jgi:hypothetical protein
MGMFSYICQETLEPALSDYGLGEAVVIFRLEKGEVKEYMVGNYDGYGRVVDKNGKPFEWDKDWDKAVDDHFNSDTSTGFALYRLEDKDFDESMFNPKVRSADDPDQGWGNDDRDIGDVVVREYPNPIHVIK